jgi:hypothetical protein
MRPQLLPLLLLVACGGKTDTAGEDLDGDGYGVAVDCDDEDEDVNPGATEQPYDGVDNDCDESTRDDDLDEDGYVESQDCDDGDPDAYPGGPEYCDGADNDCDGVVDEQALDTLSWYRDGDSDGYGDAEQGALECDRPSGYVADATDCDDSDPEVHPGAEEVWDGVDNDCDGDVDEEGGAPEFDWFHDADGDSYGDPFDAVKAAEQPSGFVANDNDCDDANPDIHPGATELCNDTDDDCDMTTDRLPHRRAWFVLWWPVLLHARRVPGLHHRPGSASGVLVGGHHLGSPHPRQRSRIRRGPVPRRGW